MYWKLTYIGSLATCPARFDFIGVMILKQSKIKTISTSQCKKAKVKRGEHLWFTSRYKDDSILR